MQTPSFRAKGILCCLLVLQLHVWPSACSLPGLPGPDGWMTVPINVGDDLDRALEGTPFSGARSLAVNVWTSEFRVASPSGLHELTGAMGESRFGSMVRSIRVSTSEAWAEAALDSDGKLTALASSSGHSWERPVDWASEATGDEESLHDALLNANDELIVASQALDAAVAFGVDLGGSGSGSGSGANPSAKVGSRSQAISGDLSGVLGLLAILLGAQFVGANFPAIFFLIQVVVSVSLLLAVFNLGGGAPQPTGGTNNPTNNGSGGQSGGTPVTGGATLRVSNVLTNDIPIWYVVPLPLAGEQAIGNLLGDEAIPSGGSRDFDVPSGTRKVNIIVPTDTDCLRVYQWNGVQLLTGEVTELVQSNEMQGVLYPSDCGG